MNPRGNQLLTHSLVIHSNIFIKSKENKWFKWRINGSESLNVYQGWHEFIGPIRTEGTGSWVDGYIKSESARLLRSSQRDFAVLSSFFSLT